MSTQDELEEILSNFFVEYKAAHLPAEMNLAVNKALAALTSREQSIEARAEKEALKYSRRLIKNDSLVLEKLDKRIGELE